MSKDTITLVLGAIGLLVSMMSVLLHCAVLAVVGLTLAGVSFGVDFERSKRR